MSKLRILMIGLGVGVLVALAGGCGSTSEESSTDGATVTADTTATATVTGGSGDTQAPDGPLDASGAVRAALAHTPGAVVDVDMDGSTWEVTVLQADGTGRELYIDAATGQVTRAQGQRLDPTQRTAPQVTAKEAIDAALAEVPGSIIELDLGLDRTTLVWEALVRADAGGRFEVYIDAATGAVRKTERDD